MHTVEDNRDTELYSPGPYCCFLILSPRLTVVCVIQLPPAPLSKPYEYVVLLCYANDVQGGQNFFAYCVLRLLSVDSDLGPEEFFSCIWTS